MGRELPQGAGVSSYTIVTMGPMWTHPSNPKAAANQEPAAGGADLYRGLLSLGRAGRLEYLPTTAHRFALLPPTAPRTSPNLRHAIYQHEHVVPAIVWFIQDCCYRNGRD
jgi:hypothetical protein